MSVKKSPKIEKLVVNAIRKLQDVQGATPKEITNYICQEYDVPSRRIQRQVNLALARAVSYGILQRAKKGYYACNRDFLVNQPQMEEPQVTKLCGCGKGHMKRGSSKKMRRRKKSAAGCKPQRRGRSKRGGGMKSSSRRRRSSRRKSGGRRGGCGSTGRSMKRRRRSSRGGATKPKRRSRSRSSRRRSSGKQCAASGGGGGGRGTGRIGGDIDSFETPRARRRSRSASGTRNERRSATSGSDDERRGDKRNDPQPINSLDS